MNTRSIDDLRKQLSSLPQKGWYRHYKNGKLYQVIGGVFSHTEKGLELCVEYIEKGSPDIKFSRLLEDWNEPMFVDDKTENSVPRFTLVENPT